MNVRQSNNYWTERNTDEFLSQQLLRGRVALVLGAGASSGFGLPDWKTLLEKMYAKKGLPLPSGQLTHVAGSFKNDFFLNDKVGFAKFVRECLYDGVDQNIQKLRDSELLQAVGALVANSARGGAAHVVSFNFDNLVEEYLATIGIVACSIDHMPAWPHQVDVQVLHPHGLLPLDQSAQPSKNGIVFTDDDYLKVMGNTADSWDRRMLDIFSSYTCIFVGLSGDDDRLMGLIQRTNEIHPAIKLDGFPYWGVVARRASPVDSVQENRWKSKGVLVRNFQTFSDIPNWMLSICQQAARQRRGEALAH